METGCVVAAVIENAASGPRGEPGSGDVLEGDQPSAERDHAPPAATGSNPPGRKPENPQEGLTTMVGSGDVTEPPAEPLLRSCVSTASMKVKNMKKLTFPRGHFPRLEECAHFHYETVDFGNVQLAFTEGQSEGAKPPSDSKELVFLVQITCQARSWLVKRSYEDFRVLDKHLHLCIYDRRYSRLGELPRHDSSKDTVESVTDMLATYLSRFSAIADNKINCGPVLTWMEIDNKGNHLLVSEEASINVPAIAAAHVTKRYAAQAADELTFEVGDIVSVIDMPPKEDTGWWRGKHGFQVGFFPCDCVELINDKLPPSVQSSVPKPVCKKHGKLVTFLRSFMKSRPPPQKLRQRGILRERVFGCDLGEHLHNSGHEVPQVVKSCADFIEKNGVVDGIYRLSGISSNIQKLRHEFDSEQIPDLSRDVFRQDIHSVGSLCKLYFRELPNPLLTYQLYERFSEAVSAATDEERLVKIHNVIQQLPPPHYRTLEFLMKHLSHLATFSPTTSMHTKNLAIVWAPNLLRSRQIESACFSGTAAFMEVRIQSVVVEFILNNTEALFSQKLNAIIRESTGNNTMSRPKSLLVCSPSTKLLSLEEAQARTQAQLSSPATTPCLSHSDYIEVGEGPGALMGKFHTVIELPVESGRRPPPAKAKRSPVGNWFSFFHLGKSHSLSKRKLKRHPSEPNEMKSIALPGGRGDCGTLRSTKSEESLTSLHNVEGEPPGYRPLRPRSTSEALSAAAAAAANDDLRRPRSKDDNKSHPLSEGHHGHASISPPQQEDDLDLCPPAAGISTLDFDPMSFQCSLLAATPGPQRSRDGIRQRKSAGCSSESEPISSPNNNHIVSCSQSPDVSPVLWKVGRGVASKPLSPKLRKKSFKTKADVQAPSASLPPLPSSSSPPAQRRSAPPAAPRPHCSPLSTASQASALTDLSQSAQNLPDPGADRLMSSVSVLPPHPPSTSAARKLALALAESAHRASGGSSHRRPPSRPFQRHEACHAQDRPARPSVLDLFPEDPRGPRVPSAAPHWQAESLFCPHPVHFPPPHLRSEPPHGAGGPDGACSFTPNVSPLWSGSPDEDSAERRGRREELRDMRQAEPTYQSVGVSTPTRPGCSARSPTASPVYVNTDSGDVFNFRAVLAEASVPASIEQVLPRPPPSSRGYGPDEDRPPLGDVYGNRPHLHHWAGPAPHGPRLNALPRHLLGPKGLYRQSSEGRYSTLGLRTPLSPQYRRYRRDEPLIGQWQRSDDRGAGHPAIRRARSFHAPQVSHYELAGAELLPPDTLFYVEQKTGRDAPYQRLVHTGVHTGVHPLRRHFDNTRAEPCYSAFSDLNPVDGSLYYVEPPRQNSGRHDPSHAKSDYYNYCPQLVPGVNRELYIESRDTVVYGARDTDAFERVVCPPVKQESQRTCPAVSPCDGPVSPADTRNRDIVHTRSKSDPGNACLLSADRTESVATSPTASRCRRAGPGAPRQPCEAGPSRRVQQAPLRKVPSLPERDRLHLRSTELRDRSHSRGPDQGPAPANYPGAVKPSILRRPGRSQSTRENRHYYHYHAKSPQDPEPPGSLSTQLNRRTQSTKVRPTQYDHLREVYAAPRPKPTRSGKAVGGFSPGQGCLSPRGHRLLSTALGQEGFCHAALRSEAGVYEGF